MTGEPPKGWDTYDPCAADANRPIQCGDCTWEGFENDVDDGLWGISDLVERLDQGGIVPVGSCPAQVFHENIGSYKCDAHVYYSDVEIVFRRKPTILDKIVEAID